MDADKWGLALSTTGLATAFASRIPDSDGLLVLAYALVGVGAWLLARDRIPARLAIPGGVVLASLAFLVAARQRLVVGFRGETLAAIGLDLGGPLWDALLVLTPLVVLAAALFVRTRSWGRASAAGSLLLAGATLLLSSQVLSFIAVGDRVVAGAFVFVFAPLLVAIASLGTDLRAIPEAGSRNGPA